MSHPQPKCMCGATALGEGHMHPDSGPPAPKGRGGPSRAGGSEGRCPCGIAPPQPTSTTWMMTHGMFTPPYKKTTPRGHGSSCDKRVCDTCGINSDPLQCMDLREHDGCAWRRQWIGAVDRLREDANGLRDAGYVHWDSDGLPTLAASSR